MREFYVDSKSVEIIGKKCTQNNLFAQNFCKLVLVVQKKTNPTYAHLFAYRQLFC